jgi:hypothetical protein
MNRRLLSLVLVSATSLGWVGCGDDSHGGGGSGGHGTTHSTTTTTTTTTGDGGAGGSSSGPPQAPIMTSVAPLQGVLHVEWENVTPDCETIELDRNLDGGAFETAYTLTGAATSQHDSSATPPGTYCYKARCTKGDMISPDSNEECGTP